jgi:hypothetical protein
MFNDSDFTVKLVHLSDLFEKLTSLKGGESSIQVMTNWNHLFKNINCGRGDYKVELYIFQG